MNRRRALISILVAVSSLFAVLIGILINMTTGQRLPLPQPPLPLLWLLLGLTTLASGVTAVFLYHLQLDPERTTSTPAQLNRQRMLGKVRAFWITGFLKHSLYGEALIALGLQEQPDAVENSWHLDFHPSGRPPRLLAPGTTITQVYDEASGELLILGEPGAGKTTLLLELARDLLARAEQDENHPMPVVFNLSSWSVKPRPLGHWLIEELHLKYQVPLRLAEEWVKADLILLLLDGLDEVSLTSRVACVDAMNAYRREHGLVPLVVCSRNIEYWTQPRRLLLHSSVMVQPLTHEQIDEYVTRAGGQLEAVRIALHDDQTLQELATTPLMLSVLTLAYRGKSVEDLVAEGSLDTRRRQILTTYVERTLRHRDAAVHYTAEQTKHWLSWLARQMVQHNQTEFHLERIQPDWLPDHHLSRLYRNTVTWLVYGCIAALIFGLFAWLRGGAHNGLGGDLETGLLGWLKGGRSEPGDALLGWMAPGFGGGLFGGATIGIVYGLVYLLVMVVICREDAGHTREKGGLQINLQRALASGLSSGLLGGTTFGFTVGLAFVASLGWVEAFTHGLAYGLAGGLIIGLTHGLASGLDHEQSRVGSGRQHSTNLWQRTWSGRWRDALTEWSNRLLDGLIIGLFGGLGFGLVSGLLNGPRSGLTYGLFAVVFTMLSLGLGEFPGLGSKVGGGLVRGLGAEIHPAEVVAWSWTNMCRGLVAALRGGLAIGFTVALSSMFIFGVISSLFHGFTYGVAFGLIEGLIVGLVVGSTIVLIGGLDGWSSNMLDEHTLMRPNQGIWYSARNSLLAGLVGGSVGGFVSGCLSTLVYALVGRLVFAPILGTGFGLVFGLTFAIIFGLYYGGRACIEHSVLQLLLQRAGCIPWNYSCFLDYATDRILLRRVGGGYMFIHRLLLDHFAGAEEGGLLPPGPPGEQTGQASLCGVCGHREDRLQARFCVECGKPKQPWLTERRPGSP